MIKFKKLLSGWERKRREVVPLSNGAVHLYSVTVQVHAFILTKKQPVMSISVILIYDKKKKNCEELLINIVFNEPAVQCLRPNSPPKCFQLSFIPFLNPYFKNNVSSVRDMKP